MEEKEIVECPECFKNYALGHSLNTHLNNKHKINKEAFIAKYPELAQRSYDVTRVVSQASQDALVKGRETIENVPLDLATLDSADVYEQMFAIFTPSERQHMLEYCEKIFQQVDRDQVLVPLVNALAIDDITLIKLTKDYAEQVKRKGVNVEGLLKQIQDCKKRMLDGMDSLGISRVAKMKNKAQIKSTPACIISAYTDEMERFTPEILAVWNREEQKVLDEIAARVKKNLLDKLPEAKVAPPVKEEAPPDVHLDQPSVSTGEWTPF